VPAAPAFHPSWPDSAKSLVLHAIERHGGWSLWCRLESVGLSLVSLRGLLPRLKGYGRTFDVPRSLVTFPHLQHTDWYDAAGALVAVFDRGDVRLLDPATGAVRAESLDHRRTFRGLRKLRRWTDRDCIYFFGYAFASYSTFPFVLPQLEFRRTVRGRWGGEPLSGVRVAYPAGVHVHSRVQSFYFDGSGLLRRNDYAADVVGRWTTGAHGWDDFETVGGLPIPTRRTVVPRLGTIASPRPIVLGATFRDLAVRASA
jgi:hypothetical protein